MKLKMKIKKRDIFLRRIEGEIEIEADTKEDILYLLEKAKIKVR